MRARYSYTHCSPNQVRVEQLKLEIVLPVLVGYLCSRFSYPLKEDAIALAFKHRDESELVNKLFLYHMTHYTLLFSQV